MEAVIVSLALGVAANALTTLLAYSGKEWVTLLGNEEFLQKLEGGRDALLPILQRAVDNTVEQLEWQNPRVQEFLISPDAEAIVRQLFATKLSGEGSRGYLATIQREFVALLAIHLDVPENRLTNTASVLFDILMESCEQALNSAIDVGKLSAHEAKSALRHHMMLDELNAIQKNLDFLTAQRCPNLSSILEFEKLYRDQVGTRHRTIVPPDFDRTRKLPIDQLYVIPDFIRLPQTPTEETETLAFDAFRSGIYRAVLLGDPGSGKSTFASKLCHDLATRYRERLLGGRLVTPIHVTLRDYGAAKKENPQSILQFIETMASADYQLLTPPRGFFEYILLNGRAIVIFDGLDELLDTSYRRVVSSDIESFCALYPSVPVLVTSRKVGYEQAQLDPAQFHVFHLAPFDEVKAATYVKNWFELDASLTTQQQEQKATAFMVESKNVPDLRANALLLALMCNIYRGDGYIPKNRPDVYEKCANMLFERWDKGRGIHYVLPFEAHVRPTLMYLAYWIYADAARQSGVTETSLVAPAADYLNKTRFADSVEAEHAARAFIEFCRGRAWVFTDTGSTAAGEPLYQFTHRTFLEYFTASYLVRTNRTPQDLFNTLLPKIMRKEWDIVAQLAFQIQNKQLEGASNELLMLLLDYKVDGFQQWNALSFAVRCLEFMIPSPQITTAITEACVDQAFVWELAPSEDTEGINWMGSHPGDVIENLYTVARENWNVVVHSFMQAIDRKFIFSGALERSIALKLSYHLPEFYKAGQIMGSLDVEPSPLSVYNKHIDEILSAAPHDYFLSLYALFSGDVSMEDVVRWHGVESIFRSEQFHLTSSSSYVYWPPIFVLLGTVNYKSDKNIKVVERYKQGLAYIGHIVLSSPLPLAGTYNLFKDKNNRSMDSSYYLEVYKREGKTEDVNAILYLGPDVLFGLLALMAVVVEVEEKFRNVQSIMKRIRSNELPVSTLFLTTLLARYTKVSEVYVQSELTKCGFSQEQEKFIWKWVRREIDLVEQPPKKVLYQGDTENLKL